MLDFSSLAPHLQISVAEKIDFFDQIEFELSSKCAKDVIRFTRHKAVIDLGLIVVDEKDVNMHRGNCSNLFQRCVHPVEPTPWKTWENISQIQNLPRFYVPLLKIRSIDSIDLFIDFLEKRLVVSKELDLVWLFKDIGVPLFYTLSEFINIRSLCVDNDCSFDQELFSLPKFCSIRRISFTVGEIANEKLLKLQSSRIILRGQAENRNCVTANLFFKEWFTKKRNIELFEIRTKLALTNGGLRINWINEEILFSGLPYEIIWQYRPHSGIVFSEYGLLRNRHLYTKCGDKTEFKRRLRKNDTVYSLDRGDKKLLVYIGEDNPIFDFIGFLQAQEYTELQEIFSVALNGE